MHIRKIQPDDVEGFLVLNQRLDAETNTMLLEPGERNSDVESLRKRIEYTVKQSNESIFVDKMRFYYYASIIVKEEYSLLNRCFAEIQGVGTNL